MRERAAAFDFILLNGKRVDCLLLERAANDCNISLHLDRFCNPGVGERVLVTRSLLSTECSRKLNVSISTERVTKYSPFGFLEPFVSESVCVTTLIVHAYCSTFSMTNTRNYHLLLPIYASSLWLEWSKLEIVSVVCWTLLFRAILLYSSLNRLFAALFPPSADILFLYVWYALLSEACKPLRKCESL